MIRFIRANVATELKKGCYDVIVQGNNCFCTWGAGAALALKPLCPNGFAADSNTTKGDQNKLGTVIYTREPGGWTSATCYTQYRYGRGDHLDLDALERVCEALRRDFTHQAILMPFIGTGHAGGDKNAVEAILTKYLNNMDVTVCHL